MKKIEEILVRCIDDIKAGKATLAECLEGYPDARSELEPLLKVALSIEEQQDIKPSEAFKARAKANLMAHIRASQSPKKEIIPSAQPSLRFGWFTGWARAVAIAVAVVLVIGTAGTATAYASQSSLPGDTLYSVKLGIEQLQRIFTFDDAAEVELELNFASIRLDELEELATMPEEQAAINDGTVLTMSVINFMPGESGKSFATQAERMEQAVAGYQENINLAISKSEQLQDNEAIKETVALAILGHLDRIDKIQDKSSETNQMQVYDSREIVINGHMKAVQNLAEVNPSRAEEINQQAIESRLKRAEDEAVKGNEKGAQNALEDMEKLNQFGDEIPGHSGGKNGNQGANQEPGNSTPSEQNGFQGSDNKQPFQDSGDNANTPDNGQGAQNEPQHNGQGGSNKEW